MAIPVRARDLRSNIAEMGFERGVVHTLEGLLDEFTEHRQNIRDVVIALDKSIDQIAVFIRLGQGLKTQIEDMKRRQDGDTCGE